MATKNPQHGDTYVFTMEVSFDELVSACGLEGLTQIAEKRRPEAIRDFYMMDINYHILGFKRGSFLIPDTLFVEVRCVLE